MRTVHTDVLVVGAGPAGLTASALLARAGVDAVTVTKYPATANSPRAHITNQRTVEVFRDLGIEDPVRAFATPNHLMGNNVWATSFTGQEIARLMTWGSGPARKGEYESASPCAMTNAPQHLLEPVLLDVAREHAADIRFSTELQAISQDVDAVHAIARLPHVWLQAGTETVSTLDICSSEDLTLLVGIGGEPWVQAAEKVAADLGVRLVTRAVGYCQPFDDVCGDWDRISGIGDDGCLLVRPYRHVAWRSATRPEHPEKALRAVLGEVLAQPDPTL